MRIIKYQRHELHGEPEDREAPLSVFVYDIPYFGACGIFPPFHIINQYFAGGGSQGGMSPGATWAPFEISRTEYLELVQAIVELDPAELGDMARYAGERFKLDPSFNNIRDVFEWVRAVNQEHCKRDRRGSHVK